MEAQKSNINQILNQIEQLSYDEKVEVMDKIIHSFKRRNIKSGHGLTGLKGLGKSIWENINVDEYINSQRQAWD